MSKNYLSPDGEWTFFSNHAHVLVCLSRDPKQTLREVSKQVGITERAVQRIVADLEQAQVLKRTRVGRRNHYQLSLNKPLRHPLESHRKIADLINLLTLG